jgi:hypothetical protein
MSDINRMLIEVNHMIMEGNAEIVEFNSGNIEKNRQRLDGDLHPEQATPETNAERIASNTARIAEIQERAATNRAKIAAVMEKVGANRGDNLLKDSEEIYAAARRFLPITKRLQRIKARIAAMIAGE